MEIVEKEKFNILKDRASCMNKVHENCNNLVPELLEALKEGFKLTVNSQFFKKDKDRLNAIIDKHRSGNKPRVYLECNEYSIILNVDDHYSTGEHGCEYYKQYVYLYSIASAKAYNFEPLEMVAEQELIVAKAKRKHIKGQISDLQSQLSKLNLLLGR